MPTFREALDDSQTSLDRLREVAEGLEPGVVYRVVGGVVSVEDRPTEAGGSRRVDLGKRHIRLGIVADTHGGSHFEQLSALREFYRYADRRKVDAFIHAGDWTQGSDKMHLDQPYQVHAHGSDQQVAYVVATYPRSERGALTYGISGNHDDSFLKDGGTNVVRAIASARPDIVYLGQTDSYLDIGPLHTYIVHPRGGAAYAKSYKLQNFARDLPIGRRVHLMLMGHLHSYAVTQEHGMTAMLLPCFQSQYGWLAAGGLHPAIGGLIVDVWLTDNDEVARIAHEFVRAQAIRDDWDHEASRAAVETWSSEGQRAR
jgi:predicted phosphodiesterase